MPQTIVLSLLLAFVLGQVLAWVYYITHSGLSYSRSYVQSLILITVVVSMVMTVIGNNIITAVGLMGALAIVRFRNVIKDTRDIVFIFCALVVGMAAGSHRYLTAILGTVVLSLIVIYLFFTDFGSHEPHNGFLRFSLRGPLAAGSSGARHPAPVLREFHADLRAGQRLRRAGRICVPDPDSQYGARMRSSSRSWRKSRGSRTSA